MEEATATTESTPAPSPPPSPQSSPSAPAASEPQSFDPQIAEAMNQRETPPAQERPISAKPFTEEYLRQAHHPELRPDPAQRGQGTATATAFDPGAFVGDFFGEVNGDEDHRAVGLLERLWDYDEGQSYTRLVNSVMEHARDHLVQQLGISRPSHIAEEDLAALPDHLRAAATTLSPSEWGELQWVDPNFRIRALETVSELMDLREKVHKTDVERYDQSIRDAHGRVDAVAQQLTEEFYQKHGEALGKWSPWGVGDKAEQSNRSWRSVVMREAVALISRANFNAYHTEQWHDALRLAEFYKTRGDLAKSSSYTEQAQKVAQMWEGEFEKLLRVTQQKFDRVLSAAVKLREYEASPEHAAYLQRTGQKPEEEAEGKSGDAPVVNAPMIRATDEDASRARARELMDKHGWHRRTF